MPIFCQITCTNLFVVKTDLDDFTLLTLLKQTPPFNVWNGWSAAEFMPFANLIKLDMMLKETCSTSENSPDVKSIVKEFEWV